MALTLQQQIQQQEATIAESRKKIADLRTKVMEKEAKRFQRIADRVGFLEADISDKALESALRKLVESAKANEEKVESTTT